MVTSLPLNSRTSGMFALTSACIKFLRRIWMGYFVIFTGLKANLGNAFGKLLASSPSSAAALPKEPYDHPFSEFLEHFSSDQLLRWHPTYELIEHLRMNPESTKCCWVFFKQKLNEFK